MPIIMSLKKNFTVAAQPCVVGRRESTAEGVQEPGDTAEALEVEDEHRLQQELKNSDLLPEILQTLEQAQRAEMASYERLSEFQERTPEATPRMQRQCVSFREFVEACTPREVSTPETPQELITIPKRRDPHLFVNVPASQCFFPKRSRAKSSKARTVSMGGEEGIEPEVETEEQKSDFANNWASSGSFMFAMVSSSNGDQRYSVSAGF